MGGGVELNHNVLLLWYLIRETFVLFQNTSTKADTNISGVFPAPVHTSDTHIVKMWML